MNVRPEQTECNVGTVENGRALPSIKNGGAQQDVTYYEQDTQYYRNADVLLFIRSLRRHIRVHQIWCVSRSTPQYWVMRVRVGPIQSTGATVMVTDVCTQLSLCLQSSHIWSRIRVGIAGRVTFGSPIGITRRITVD